ncbi:toll/interleukin-1 receptor domain-containing protein [Paraburkholderia sp. SIMBA_049]
MAFVPAFEHDIFISYGRVDDLGAEKWVTNFHGALELALAQRHGRVGGVKLWRDTRDLDPNQLFDETIQTAIERAALFLAVTSHAFLGSDYCLKELRCFHKKAGNEKFGLYVGDRMRIYSVFLKRFSPEVWPEEFGRVTGFPFHDADEDDLPDRKGERTDQTGDTTRFRRQIRALSESIFTTLEAMQQATAGMVHPARHDEAAGARPQDVVFVADASDALAVTRRRLMSDLERKGIQVRSGVPPPYEAGRHDETVKQVTQEAMLSVHLLDSLPGRSIDGIADTTYPIRQAEIACEHGRSQLIWVSPDSDLRTVEDERYRTWLDRIENGERRNAHYDFIRQSSTLLVPQILEKLEQLRRPPEHPAEQRTVLLDTHIKDQLYALQLSQTLLAKKIQPYINPQDDGVQKNLPAFEARLSDVTTFIVLHGAVDYDWVIARLTLALQLSVTKQLPINSWNVLIVPPKMAGEKSSFRLGPVLVRLLDAGTIDTLFDDDSPQAHA